MRRKYIARSNSTDEIVGVWWNERHKQFWVGGHDGCRDLGDAILHAASSSVHKGRNDPNIVEVSYTTKYAGNRWRRSLEYVDAKAFDKAVQAVRKNMPEVGVTPVRSFRRLTY